MWAPISQNVCMRKQLSGLLLVLGLTVLAAQPTFAGTYPPGFEESVFAGGLNLPTAMEFAPDGRLFVCEKGGALRVILPDGTLLQNPFLSVSVVSNSERGLLGVAFDPDFANNRYVYVYYTRVAPQPVKNRLSRFRASLADPNVAEPGSEVVLLDDIASDAGNHNGGAIHFGRDGKLYIGIGDGGANASNSQDLATLSGKLLRIDPAAFPNIVPPDNPFVATPGARGEIWAYGLRNPFTFAVQPATGNLLINDVGQNSWEEVNRGIGGANYGWPLAEGLSTNPAFTNPNYTYPHGSGGASITGATFYTSGPFGSAYTDNYFFGDYVQGFVRRLLPPDYTQVADFGTGVSGLVDLKVGPDGALYTLSFGSGVSKVSFVGTGNRAPQPVIRSSTLAGNAPLRVSFSGLTSSDPDGDRLRYFWNFGDGTTASGALTSHLYQTGRFTASLTVSDTNNASATASVTVNSGNNLPTAAISQPTEGTTYTGGTTVQFSGSASDPEEGVLPPSAYSWKVTFYHADHTHPFLGPIAGITGGSFEIPTTGETAPDVFYRIELTATDATGLQRTVSRDVIPVRSTITLRSEPPGLQLTLDGQPLRGREQVEGVVGIVRTLGAPLTQTLGEATYEFVGWSDGGAATHTITTPATATTYTATYRRL